MPTRREFMQRSAVVGGALAGLGAVGASTACATGSAMERATSEGHVTRAAAKASTIKQSVCRWCFNDMPLDDLAANAKRIGLHSVELIGPADFETIKKHGLMCAMVSQAGPGGIPKGWNRVDNHSWLIPAYQERITQVAAEKWPNVICFSGNRDGLGDEEGLANCAKGLKQLMPAAEQAGVTVCMELLNSKVNHPDYQCDHTPWGVKLVQMVDSPRFRLLYDIYHMQIMEGDVIHTIRDNHQHIAHYHTAGVPGRHEIDESQELFYPAVMKAIVDTGYTGYVAQEFVPVKKELGMVSLEDAYKRCAV
ncbi:MAG: TIM barrel protein [Gemmatimonadetes bacterium]|nr:TIM barrel protein [Gemmatimonadota bacterium]